MTFNNLFRDLIYNNSKKEEILQVYLGKLSGETVFSICNELEKGLKAKKFPKLIIKRTFFLALEILQNQLLHGFNNEQKEKKNYFICSFDTNDIVIIAGNLIRNSEVASLTERIQHVNESLLDNTLRELYLNQLTNNRYTKNGGGGLGFIKMATVTGNSIDFDFSSINEDYSVLNLRFSLSHTNTDNSSNINFEELFSLVR